MKEFGGLGFVENMIDGYWNVNGGGKGGGKMLVRDEEWENEGKGLVNGLRVWVKVLGENESGEEMGEKGKERGEKGEKVVNDKLKNGVGRRGEVERGNEGV